MEILTILMVAVTVEALTADIVSGSYLFNKL